MFSPFFAIGEICLATPACNDVSYKSAFLAATMAETSYEGAGEQALSQVDVPRPSLHLDHAFLERRTSVSLPRLKEASAISIPPGTQRTSSRIHPFGRMVAKISAVCLLVFGGWSV
jgi:hypothetical protein